MTTHGTPAVADDHPSWAIELAPGALPCAACGAATPETRDASRTELSPEVGPVLLFHDGAQRLPGPRFTLTMCPACQARHRAAHRLADSLPGLASHVGGDPRAALAVVLDGLAVVTTAALPRLADEDAARLLRHLREASGHVRFVGLLVPPIAEGVRPGLAAREPWAHVDEVTRSDLTRGFARFLAAGVARHSAPVQLTPPRGRGCLLCGVAQVPVPAAEVAALGGREDARGSFWRPLSASSHVLGGPRSPAKMHGSVCPACTDALEREGVVGLSAVRGAWLAHLRAGGHPQGAVLPAAEAERLEGVIAWGAWAAHEVRAGRPEPEPNTEPWGHLHVVMPEDVPGEAT